MRIREHLREIVRGTEWEGHLYAVGGCCRDEIMGLPIKDVDMTVDLPGGGIRFANWCFEHGYAVHSPVIFPEYGTARLRLKDFPDEDIELVQTRKEKYTDHTRRNPETAYGTLEEDCMRRDLTINSLYYDLSEERFVDITEKGMSDIKNRIIRTPSDPDLTYDDDPLRILRCIRFASRYGWKIEQNTYAGICRHADRLEIISAERIKAELDKMLTGPAPGRALELLKESGVMRHVLPELCETYELKQNHYHFGTVWEHTLKVVEGVPSDLTLRMAALLHDIGKIRTRTVGEDGAVHFLLHERASCEMTGKILRRLKYPKPFIKEVEFIVYNHMRLKAYGDDATKLKDKNLRKLQYLCQTKERFENLLTLIDSDNRAHAPEHCMPRQVETVRQRSSDMEDEGSSMFGYRLPLSGDDVIRIKGLRPGPVLKECLDYLWKLAFVNPRRSPNEWEKLLLGYRIKEK